MKKWLKILLIVLAVIVGLLLLIRFVGSPVAKAVIEKKCSEWIGRQVKIGSLSISPFSGNVKIKHLSVTDEADTTTFVSWEELYVNVSLIRLIGKHVYLRHIHLNDFNINVWNDGERFNFSDLPHRFASDDSTAVQDTTPSSWRITLNDIRLHDGNIGYADRPRAQNWNLEHLRIYVPGLQFGGEQTDAGLRFDLPDDAGSVQLRGSYNMQSNSYSLIADLNDIDLNFILPMVQDYLTAKGIDGMLHAHIIAHGSLDDVLGVTVEGKLDIEDFELRDADRNTCAEIENLRLGINRIVPKTMIFDFDSLLIDGLALNITRDKDGNTVSRLMQSSETVTDTIIVVEETEKSTSSNATPKLRIAKFSLTDSEINYTDKTLPSKFSYKLSDVRATANNLTLTDQNHILLNANLPDGGSMMLNWRGNIDFMTGDARVVAMVRNLQLDDLSPWVEYMFAYPVKQGTLSLTSDNSIRKGMIDGMQKIDIYNLKLGKKDNKSDAELKNIPLKSAIGLVTDLNGKILIEVPVEGNMKEPKFSFGKVISMAIGNVLLKATAAPFVAMAQAKNLHVGDLSQIQINFLQPDLSLEQYKKLDLIAQLMREQENLSLQMIQQFNLNSAIEEQALFNLKQSYYQQNNPNAIGSLTLLDIEKIQKISTSDSKFKQYAEQTIGKGGSLNSRAMNYYTPDSLQTQVMKQAETRNLVITNYLTKQQNISKDRINITTDTEQNLKSFKGQYRYEVKSEIADAE